MNQSFWGIAVAWFIGTLPILIVVLLTGRELRHIRKDLRANSLR